MVYRFITIVTLTVTVLVSLSLVVGRNTTIVQHRFRPPLLNDPYGTTRGEVRGERVWKAVMLSNMGLPDALNKVHTALVSSSSRIVSMSRDLWIDYIRYVPYLRGVTPHFVMRGELSLDPSTPSNTKIEISGHKP